MPTTIGLMAMLNRILTVNPGSYHYGEMVKIPIFGDSRKLVIFIGGWGATPTDLEYVQLRLHAAELSDWAWCSLSIDDTVAPGVTLVKPFDDQGKLLHALLQELFDPYDPNPIYDQVMVVTHSMGAIPALLGHKVDLLTANEYHEQKAQGAEPDETNHNLSVVLMVPPLPENAKSFRESRGDKAYSLYVNSDHSVIRMAGISPVAEYGHVVYPRSKDPITVTQTGYVSDLEEFDWLWHLQDLKRNVGKVGVIYALDDNVVGGDYTPYAEILGDENVIGVRGDHTFQPHLPEMFAAFRELMLK